MNLVNIENFSQLPQPIIVKKVQHSLADFNKDPLGQHYWLRIPKIGDYITGISIIAPVQSVSELKDNLLTQSFKSGMDSLDQTILFQNTPDNPIHSQIVPSVPYSSFHGQQCRISLQPFQECPLLQCCMYSTELYVGLTMKTPPTMPIILEYYLGFLTQDTVNLLMTHTLRIKASRIDGWIQKKYTQHYQNGVLQINQGL